MQRRNTSADYSLTVKLKVTFYNCSEPAINPVVFWEFEIDSGNLFHILGPNTRFPITNLIMYYLSITESSGNGSLKTSQALPMQLKQPAPTTMFQSQPFLPLI